MGSTFANLLVRASDPADLEVVRRVLVDLAAREGLRAAADGEAPDREIALVQGGGWVSIHDQGDPVGERLDAAATALSRALDSPVFSARVFDSDALQLVARRGGAIVDRYESDPAAFGGKKTKKAPHAPAWATLLGVPEAALKNVFEGSDLFAEHALGPLAAALGLPAARLTASHEDLAGTDAIRLRFRLLVRPAWESRPVGPPALAIPGLPAGTVGRSRQTVEAAAGAEIRLSLTAKSTGGPSRGIRVAVTAPPFVRPESAQLVLGDPHARAVRQLALVPDGDAFAAEDADAPLPAGLGPLDPAALDKVPPQELVGLLSAANVHVNVVCRAVGTGEGEVRVALAPSAEPSAGVAALMPVAVRDVSDRPLGSSATVHPTLLAPLLGRNVLAALVLADVPRTRLAAVAEAVAAFLPDLPKVRTTMYPGGMLAKPKLTTGKAAGFLASQRWRDLVAAESTAWAEWIAGAESRGQTRIELGRGILPSTRAVLGLAVNLDGGDLDGAQAALTRAIDALAAEGGLLQAFVTRWGAGASLEGTPWEMACGVMGQCVLERPWVERYLRGIGAGAVWLGPALATAAGGPTGIPLGEAVRVDVVERSAAEKALEGIIPNSAAWQQGVRARYAR